MRLEWNNKKAETKKHEYEIVNANGNQGFFFIVYKKQNSFFAEWDEEEIIFISPCYFTESLAKAAAQAWEDEHNKKELK
jgi:hypothetical protein